ncbi:MAG: hypothetical protein ACPHL6_00045, partial [Rubripirellula sp.]
SLGDAWTPESLFYSSRNFSSGNASASSIAKIELAIQASVKCDGVNISGDAKQEDHSRCPYSQRQNQNRQTRR